MDKQEILSEELYDKFDSQDLLLAVGHLDIMRRHLADRVAYKPPEIREDLMKLHEMVMEVSNGSSAYSLDDILMQVGEVESPIFHIQEEAEKIITILRDLNRALNSAFNRIEEEAE